MPFKVGDLILDFECGNATICDTSQCRDNSAGGRDDDDDGDDDGDDDDDQGEESRVGPRSGRLRPEHLDLLKVQLTKLQQAVAEAEAVVKAPSEPTTLGQIEELEHRLEAVFASLRERKAQLAGVS